MSKEGNITTTVVLADPYERCFEKIRHLFGKIGPPHISTLVKHSPIPYVLLSYGREKFSDAVCYLHIKPFFLLNDISTPSVRADSF